MMNKEIHSSITRRTAVKWMGLGCLAVGFRPWVVLADARGGISKPIPSTGERLPVVGLGTWRTFNVGRDPKLRAECFEVLDAFFQEGGGMVDCSPMYGSAQEVLGAAFARTGVPETLFSADKIWTDDGAATRAQAAESARLWGIEHFDLLQVHNLVAWQPHLETLREMKKNGQVRYIGITTSHGRRHREFEQIMNEPDLDFVQLTYNITHPEVENRLLPLARERNLAVIANRPYDGGALIRRLKADYSLPEWAAEIGCGTWAEFLLKWIVSHPAMTCAIPATSRVEHLKENMQAARGELPDAATRKRMAEYVRSL